MVGGRLLYLINMEQSYGIDSSQSQSKKVPVDVKVIAFLFTLFGLVALGTGIYALYNNPKGFVDQIDLGRLLPDSVRVTPFMMVSGLIFALAQTAGGYFSQYLKKWALALLTFGVLASMFSPLLFNFINGIIFRDDPFASLYEDLPFDYWSIVPLVAVAWLWRRYFQYSMNRVQ